MYGLGAEVDCANLTRFDLDLHCFESDELCAFPETEEKQPRNLMLSVPWPFSL